MGTLAPTTTPGPTTTVTTVFVEGPCTTEGPTTLAPTTTPGPTTTVTTLPGPCTTVVALKLYSDGDKSFLKKTADKPGAASQDATSLAFSAPLWFMSAFAAIGGVLAVMAVVRVFGRSRHLQNRT